MRYKPYIKFQHLRDGGRQEDQKFQASLGYMRLSQKLTLPQRRGLECVGDKVGWKRWLCGRGEGEDYRADEGWRETGHPPQAEGQWEKAWWVSE